MYQHHQNNQQNNNSKTQTTTETISFNYTIADGITGKATLPIFSGENGQDFAEWLSIFENTSRICGWTAAIKRTVLPTVLRGTPEQAVSSNATSSYTAATTTLKNLYYPASSVAFYQQELMTIKKRLNENIEEYATRINRLVHRYNLSVPNTDQELTDTQSTVYFYNGLPESYKQQITFQGITEMAEMKAVCNRLFGYEHEKRQHSAKGNNNNQKKNQNNSSTQPKPKPQSFNGQPQKAKKYCYYHKTNTHAAEDCHYLKNRQQKPRNRNDQSSNAIQIQSVPSHNQETNQNADSNSYSSNQITFHPHVESIKVKTAINNKNYWSLIDSGSQVSLISADILKDQKLQANMISSNSTIVTANKQKSSSIGIINLFLKFPELSQSSAFPVKLVVIENLNADIILGMDFLVKSLSKIDFENQVLHIGSYSLSFSLPSLSVPTTSASSDFDIEDEFFNKTAFNYSVSSVFVKPSSPSSSSPANKSTEPSPTRLNLARQNTYQLLQKEFTTIIGSDTHIGKLSPKLGHHQILLKDKNQIVNKKPYSTPLIHLPKVKAEIKKLLSLGIIQSSASSFASPAFPVVKRNGDLRLVVDYRQLNSISHVSRFPIPDPKSLFLSLKDSKIFSQIDLNSGYFQIPMSPESIPYTAFVLPFGQYEFTRMPFGLSGAPATFQQIMSNLFKDYTSFIFVYLDDILVYSKTIEQHQGHLQQVFTILSQASLTINIAKSNMFSLSVEYLGYIIDGEGIRPSDRHLEAFKSLQMPTNKRGVRRIIGILNFFRTQVHNFSTRLAPIINLTKDDVPFTWNDSFTTIVHQIIDDLIERSKTYFPDFNAPFDLYSDASDHGLGAVIIQNNLPIYFFSKTLSSAELNYTTTEKELLAIVLCLKKCKKFLLGTTIRIHTNHSNLLYITSTNSQRVIRWRILIDEFSPQFHYLKGDRNILADSLSRKFNINQVSLDLSSDAQKHQIISFFHYYLCHPGITRQYQTMKSLYQWPNMFKQIVKFINDCQQCNTMKFAKSNYGTLSGHLSSSTPFSFIALDIVGPFSFSSSSDQALDHLSNHSDNSTSISINSDFKYYLSIIDICTRWVELVPLKNITANEVTLAFKNNWLFRYPRPSKVLTDNGKQFLSATFLNLLDDFLINSITTSTYNPTGNSIVERIHSTINNSIRAMNIQNLEEILPQIAYSLRISFHKTLQCSPAELVFGFNMLSKQPVDQSKLLEQAIENKNSQSQQSLNSANSKRINYEFQINDFVFVKNMNLTKTSPRYSGPYRIVKINQNNTLRLDFNTHHETVSFQKVKPVIKEKRNVA